MRHVASRYDRVHDQHLAPRPKRAVARLKDPRRRIVVAVVDNRAALELVLAGLEGTCWGPPHARELARPATR